MWYGVEVVDLRQRRYVTAYKLARRECPARSLHYYLVTRSQTVISRVLQISINTEL